MSFAFITAAQTSLSLSVWAVDRTAWAFPGSQTQGPKIPRGSIHKFVRWASLTASPFKSRDVVPKLHEGWEKGEELREGKKNAHVRDRERNEMRKGHCRHSCKHQQGIYSVARNRSSRKRHKETPAQEQKSQNEETFQEKTDLPSSPNWKSSVIMEYRLPGCCQLGNGLGWEKRGCGSQKQAVNGFLSLCLAHVSFCSLFTLFGRRQHVKVFLKRIFTLKISHISKLNGMFIEK